MSQYFLFFALLKHFPEFLFRRYKRQTRPINNPLFNNIITGKHSVTLLINKEDCELSKGAIKIAIFTSVSQTLHFKTKYFEIKSHFYC